MKNEGNNTKNNNKQKYQEQHKKYQHDMYSIISPVPQFIIFVLGGVRLPPNPPFHLSFSSTQQNIKTTKWQHTNITTSTTTRTITNARWQQEICKLKQQEEEHQQEKGRLMKTGCCWFCSCCLCACVFLFFIVCFCHQHKLALPKQTTPQQHQQQPEQNNKSIKEKPTKNNRDNKICNQKTTKKTNNQKAW